MKFVTLHDLGGKEVDINVDGILMLREPGVGDGKKARTVVVLSAGFQDVTETRAEVKEAIRDAR